MLAAVLLAISSVIYQATQCGTNTHTHANTYAAVFNKNSQKKLQHHASNTAGVANEEIHFV